LGKSEEEEQKCKYICWGFLKFKNFLH
jgi:hypothetical protein